MNAVTGITTTLSSLRDEWQGTLFGLRSGLAVASGQDDADLKEVAMTAEKASKKTRSANAAPVRTHLEGVGPNEYERILKTANQSYRHQAAAYGAAAPAGDVDAQAQAANLDKSA